MPEVVSIAKYFFLRNNLCSPYCVNLNELFLIMPEVVSIAKYFFLRNFCASHVRRLKDSSLVRRRTEKSTVCVILRAKCSSCGSYISAHRKNQKNISTTFIGALQHGAFNQKNN
jgi:hypothetical protein